MAFHLKCLHFINNFGSYNKSNKNRINKAYLSTAEETEVAFRCIYMNSFMKLKCSIYIHIHEMLGKKCKDKLLLNMKVNRQ